MAKNFEKWTSTCGRVTLYRGDCLDVMPTMDADSIDSVISDPPYGLKFMGKKWDHGVPGVPFWEAAKRVMKPGAMLLAFGGTRTFHRLTCAIEDAGLEVRDCLMWLYGSGFPKSHDISKGIDKAAGAERDVIKTVKKCHYSGSDLHSNDGWSRPSHRNIDGTAKRTMDITAPATPAAQEWDGYGTALKPAWEPITLAMRPLDGTFASNALKHGVAGLNIDGGRIACAEGSPSEIRRAAARRSGNAPGRPGEYGPRITSRITPERYMEERPGEQNGRWPANVILDEAAAAELDAQSSESDGASRFFKVITADPLDSGRFWYCAKPSKAERNAGLEGMAKGDSPKSKISNPAPGRKLPQGGPQENYHPTCKPVKLLRYLALLTKTPTGGVVLDPFMGSGSTGVAAVLEGRGFIGIEKELEYFEIAKRRLAHALAEYKSDMFAGVEVG